MESWIKYFFVTGISLAVTFEAHTDSEPVDPDRTPYPETGAWAVLQESYKSGFFFEVQDGILAGAYFGFDGDGQNIWVTFSGALMTSSLPGVSAIIEADLRQDLNGQCILNCAQAPEMPTPETSVEGTIRIEFMSRSLGRFSVDGGEMQRIVPLVWGSGGFVEFPEHSDLLLPVLTGKWAADLTTATVDEPTTVLFEIAEREVTGTGAQKRVVYPVEMTAGGVTDLNAIVANTAIVCELIAVFGSDDEPRCAMELPPEIFNTAAIGAEEAVFFSLESINDSRISLTVNVSTDPPLPGTVNLYRLKYD